MPLNRENFTRVLEHIKQLPEGKFNMAFLCALPGDGPDATDRPVAELLDMQSKACGCIAGHTLALFEPQHGAVTAGSLFRAGEYLGLRSWDSDHLFLGYWQIEGYWAITRQQAIARMEAILAQDLAEQE